MMARYDRDYAGREHFGEDQAKALLSAYDGRLPMPPGFPQDLGLSFEFQANGGHCFANTSGYPGGPELLKLLKGE